MNKVIKSLDFTATIYKRMGYLGMLFSVLVPLVIGVFLSLAFPNGVWLTRITSGFLFLSLMAMTLWCFFMARVNKKEKVVKEQDYKEKMLYAFAAKQGGILKAASVATLLGISKAEAEAYVVDLIKQSQPISFEIDNDGEFVFYFDVPKTRVATMPEAEEEFLEEEYESEQKLRR
ncbi:MAG TPA: hypothetical protein VM577_14865 [Anaerovoracaceae bacterium]|nr:hypothetical protein [Anaerovoracaceae bacterium]